MMARMTFQGGDEYVLKLSKIHGRSEETAKRAIYKAADIVADAIRANLTANLAGSTDSTGALLDSLGITPITQDKSGNWNTKIGFDGYDKRGVPNQLKARVMESGSSSQRKRPFVRPAVQATKKAAMAAMEQTINEEYEKLMKG